MPSIPNGEEEDKSSSSLSDTNKAKELTQTDHLNKRLLTSFLQSINANETNSSSTSTNDSEASKENDSEWEK